MGWGRLTEAAANLPITKTASRLIEVSAASVLQTTTKKQKRWLFLISRLSNCKSIIRRKQMTVAQQNWSKKVQTKLKTINHAICIRVKSKTHEKTSACGRKQKEKMLKSSQTPGQLLTSTAWPSLNNKNQIRNNPQSSSESLSRIQPLKFMRWLK